MWTVRFPLLRGYLTSTLYQSWVKINLGGPSAGLSAAEYYLKFISRFPSIVKKNCTHTSYNRILYTHCLNKNTWTSLIFRFRKSEPRLYRRARKFGSKVLTRNRGRAYRRGLSWFLDQGWLGTFPQLGTNFVPQSHSRIHRPLSFGHI